MIGFSLKHERPPGSRTGQTNDDSGTGLSNPVVAPLVSNAPPRAGAGAPVRGTSYWGHPPRVKRLNTSLVHPPVCKTVRMIAQSASRLGTYFFRKWGRGGRGPGASPGVPNPPPGPPRRLAPGGWRRRRRAGRGRGSSAPRTALKELKKKKDSFKEA
jgi:hypothetical protein